MEGRQIFRRTEAENLKGSWEGFKRALRERISEERVDIGGSLMVLEIEKGIFRDLGKLQIENLEEELELTMA